MQQNLMQIKDHFTFPEYLQEVFGFPKTTRMLWMVVVDRVIAVMRP
jgi:hypothetical protein